jgi:imidazoleglycerol phosphate synthase glutamine amidotransferase subunit HisH
MKIALSSKYDITTFSEEDCNTETLKKFDMVAFPGGIGDSNSYDKFFRRKAQNAVADYVANGGRYLGICMGAYWAGSYYFDILDGVDAVQYIKQPTATVKRSYGTVADVLWNNKSINMYFYDGCALIGDTTKFKTIATYANGDAMAIIQNRIGIIGCHPESLKYWYEAPWNYINQHWHKGEHHTLLLEFVDELMQK